MEKETSSRFGATLWGNTWRTRLLFLLKVLLVLLPILFFRGLPLFKKIESGEYTPIPRVVDKQLKNRNILFGPAYTDESTAYKLEMVKRIHPYVLALGNSKILTMRSVFFTKEGGVFYNAGGSAQDVAGFRKFLEESKTVPSTIIMTVDPVYFNPSVAFNAVTEKQSYEPLSYWEKVSRVNNSWVSHDPLRENILKLLRLVVDTNTIGVNARVYHDGFRVDGSWHYGSQYDNPSLRYEKIKNDATHIAAGLHRGDKEFFSSQAVSELDAFLAYCKERNIYVIGYVPSMPVDIQAEYKKHPEDDYIFHTYEQSASVFKKYNFTIYNFFDISALGGTEEEFLDGYHTNEKAMLRILIKISDDKMLSKVVDKAYLQKLLTTAKDGNDVLK